MAIGSFNTNTNGDASPLTQEASLNAPFGSSVGFGPVFFPPNGALVMVRPSTATSSQFLSKHHILEDNVSTVLETHQPQSIAETSDVRRNWNRFRLLSEHSIDSPFVEQKILHPLPPGVAQVGGGNPKGALLCGGNKGSILCHSSSGMRHRSFLTTAIDFELFLLMLL